MPTWTPNLYLIAAREAKGLTKKQLAEKLGAREAWVYQLETGRRTPDPNTLVRLAEALDCTVGDLDPRFAPKKTSKIPSDR